MGVDCRVAVEAAVPVYDVSTPDEAVRIAISKTGEMLNPDLNYVEISMHERTCPHCEGGLETAFIAADEGLVALELEMTVFNVEREEHASRIARKEIGQRLDNIPLEVLEVEELDEDDAADSATDFDSDPAEPPSSAAEPAATELSETSEPAPSSSDDDSEEDLLPDFDDLVEG